MLPLGGFNLLNFTDFKNKLSQMTDFEGFTPRYTLLGRLRAVQTKDDDLLPRNTSTMFVAVVSINT